MSLSKLFQHESILIPGNRVHKGMREIVIRLIAITFTLFHLYTAGFGAFPNTIQRSIHVCFAVILVFLLYSVFTKKQSKGIAIFDYLAVAVAIISPVWIYINYERFHSVFSEFSWFDYTIAFLTILVVLEASRRVVDWSIPIMAVVAILYAIYGNFMPGILRHQGFSVSSMVESLYTSTSGLWGAITSASATQVAIFIIFGAVLLHTGGSEAFSNLALRVSGTARGGPAKIATLSSALFGSISGSSAANVAVTGSVTIPMMKRLGYKPEFAAAVEGVASTGGQLLPPVMGAASFIMAEMLGVSYLTIALSAAIPAILYYLTFYISVHFYSLKHNYRGLEKHEIPSNKVAFNPALLIQVLLPMIFLVMLLIEGYSTPRAGFYATVLLVVLYLLRMAFTDIKNIKFAFLKLVRALEDAGFGMVLLAVMASSAQIIVSILGTTGLGVLFSQIIIDLGNGSLFMALLLTALIVIILGLGLPTIASYMIGAAVVASAMTKLGVDPIAAHMFILYFAVLSGITPPVCATIFISAGMANANWMKTAWLATKLGIIAYLLPFLFVYSPEILLLHRDDVIGTIFAVATAAIAGILLVSGTTGYFLRRNQFWESTLFFVLGIVMIIPGFSMDIIGIAGMVALLLYQRMTKNKFVTPQLTEVTN